LENLPIGFVTGEMYSEQSVCLQPGDMILAFSDGATEVQSPGGGATDAARILAISGIKVRKVPGPVRA
jgi:serine phosphatase RsbU (regulator of sigma subunit)